MSAAANKAGLNCNATSVVLQAAHPEGLSNAVSSADCSMPKSRARLLCGLRLVPFRLYAAKHREREHFLDEGRSQRRLEDELL